MRRKEFLHTGDTCFFYAPRNRMSQGLMSKRVTNLLPTEFQKNVSKIQNRRFLKLEEFISSKKSFSSLPINFKNTKRKSEK